MGRGSRATFRPEDGEDAGRIGGAAVSERPAGEDRHRLCGHCGAGVHGAGYGGGEELGGVDEKVLEKKAAGDKQIELKPETLE